MHFMLFLVFRACVSFLKGKVKVLESEKMEQLWQNMNHFCWERARTYIVSLCALLQNQMCLSSLYEHKQCSCLFIAHHSLMQLADVNLPD